MDIYGERKDKKLSSIPGSMFLHFTLLLTVVSSKPNLVLILLDDMGWGDPGYQNFTDHNTPNMDR